jgi:flagellar export protein FliJ
VKNFRFPLERVLQLRHRSERERAQEMGRALRVEDLRRQELEDAHDRLEQAGEKAAGKPGEVATAGTLRNLGLALHAAVQAVDAAETHHDEAVETVREEQERFGEARKELRVVERLREQQHERWTQEVSRKEQAQVDEVASQRHGRDETKW